MFTNGKGITPTTDQEMVPPPCLSLDKYGSGDMLAYLQMGLC